jgi:glutathione reductase (NADPH)
MLRLNLENGETIDSEVVLAALGRPPAIEGLNLEAAGIETERGAVKVDDYQNTSAKGVYAIGDVINKINLTPVAIRAGRILAERLFNEQDNCMQYENVATVVFSHPPIGTVGLTEEAAIEKFGEDKIKVYKSTFVNMFYSTCPDQDQKHKTMFKLVCADTDGKKEKVVGLHAIGRNVDEMM